MKTITRTVTEILKDRDCPIDLSVIPNYMGINLCSVEAVTWTRQDDGQLVSMTFHFIPAAVLDKRIVPTETITQ